MSATKQFLGDAMDLSPNVGPDLATRLAKALRKKEMAGRRLVIKSGTRMVVLQRHKIEWVESEREYARLHVGRESHLVRQTMNVLEQVLGDNFIRVHRSTIVNLDFVHEMRPLECGDYEITMRDGGKLKLSRNHRACLQELLQDSFRSDPFPAGEEPLAQ